VAIPEAAPTLAISVGAALVFLAPGLLLRSFLPDQKLVDQKFERFEKE
jgi:hypothetical protein